MIHPTAVVDPGARLDATVVVGPHAVIDAGVTLGANCRVGPHVHLTGNTRIGPGNVFHSGCVIGDEPQDLKYTGAPTGLVIGEKNIFREHVTVHRSNKLEEETVIGSNNLFMAGSHVGHNCQVGNHVILVNGALLAGHVTVEDRVFISGHAMVHQFVRLGTLSLMQGRSGISKDLPPFTIARGVNHIGGLNVIGLRRAGFGGPERLELRRLYHHLFRSGKNVREAAASATGQFSSEGARTMLNFINASRRGVCAPPGQGAAEDDSAE